MESSEDLHSRAARRLCIRKEKRTQKQQMELTEAMNYDIRRIIENHTPPVEPEVCHYIESMVEESISDAADAADVASVLTNFLSEDETRQIVSLMMNTSSGRLEEETTNTVTENASVRLNLSSHLNDGGKIIPPSTQHHNPSAYPDREDDESTSKSPKSKPQTKSQLRKEARREKKNAITKQGGNVLPAVSELVNDDHASAWKECTESNQHWGGRGHGGRGIRMTGDNFQNIHLPSVSLSYEGNELLVDSKMDIVKGHRYGLLGRNGVGKSTLLRQLASGSIPGMPRGIIIRMVKQQVEGRNDQSTLEALVEADEYRTSLLQEQDVVERKIDSGVDLEECTRRMGDIVVELDAIDADNAETRAMEILKGLSFTEEMIYGPTINLSGGWRMRLALAQTLFAPYSDLILLDECTNHLDLHGMAWLENYLTANDLTIICVSHDRSFLDAISTDIIVLAHKRLTYHSGNYTDYRIKMEEKAAREAQIIDASERQRSKAISFVQKHQQQSKKSSDPNKQRQAKMIKEKKLDRIGNYRVDGKRYKQFSLEKMSDDYVRLAQKVVVEIDEPIVALRLPNPAWPPSITDQSPLIQVENVNFSYNTSAQPDAKLLLKELTFTITRRTKAAVVGANGCGKTSLLKLLAGEMSVTKRHGAIRKHPNIRVGYINQYSIEELNKYAHMTVVEYAEANLSSGDVCSSITFKSSGNIRQYLGMFGLGGAHANRPIHALSGGERMRLCFATVLSSMVHVILLDEATNHIDLETMDSLSNALQDWQGAIIMVSHNQGFLSGFCNELWSFSEEEKGKLEIAHDDTESFEELFVRYKSNMLSGGGKSSISARGMRLNMAKRAARLSANVSKHTALL